jgi:hypothetical protein
MEKKKQQAAVAETIAVAVADAVAVTDVDEIVSKL